MFEISVNGRIFSNWQTATIQRTIDENSGKFQFSSSNVVPANYPIRAGDSVQILVNKQAMITGFCDVLESSVEDGTDTIAVAGRDNTADLIDSSMPDAVKSIEGPLSMKALCEQVIVALGAEIPVVNEVPSITEFNELEFFNADAGKNCMTFLTDFARKRQVYLIPDGNGSLVIYRPDEVITPGALMNRRNDRNNNIISSTVRFDHSARFNKYSSRSQDNFGADPDADYSADGVDRQGEATDVEIRTSRFLEVQPEESMTETETVDRSVEELNIRRGRSTEYRATVAGVERAPGVLWDIGQLVKINDDFADMQGIFIVRAVTLSVDKNTGTRTVLTVAPPETYNVRLPTQGDTRRAEQGDKFQDRNPAATAGRFKR